MISTTFASVRWVGAAKVKINKLFLPASAYRIKLKTEGVKQVDKNIPVKMAYIPLSLFVKNNLLNNIHTRVYRMYSGTDQGLLLIMNTNITYHKTVFISINGAVIAAPKSCNNSFSQVTSENRKYISIHFRQNQHYVKKVNPRKT